MAAKKATGRIAQVIGAVVDVQFVDAIPHTATGKILKTALREQFKDYQLPTVNDE